MTENVIETTSICFSNNVFTHSQTSTKKNIFPYNTVIFVRIALFHGVLTSHAIALNTPQAIVVILALLECHNTSWNKYIVAKKR